MGMGNQQRPPMAQGPAGGYMAARPAPTGGGMMSQIQRPSQAMPVRRPMNPIPQPMPAMQTNPQQQALAQLIAQRGLVR